jgi:hypothetical protein
VSKPSAADLSEPTSTKGVVAWDCNERLRIVADRPSKSDLEESYDSDSLFGGT